MALLRSSIDRGLAPRECHIENRLPTAHSPYLAYNGLGSSAPKLRLLDGLAPLEREDVLAAASHRHFSQTSVPVHQGDPADRLFLLIKGSARYFFITPDGRKVYLIWLSPGEIFGVGTLLPQPSHFLVNTEVVKDSDVLTWRRDIIRDLITRYPRLLENGLCTTNDYLVWYLASHLSLICHTARQRLAHVLVSLAHGIGRKSPTGVHVNVTNEQLANTANVTLFTASRLLSEWRRAGAIAKSRGKIVLVHPQRLFYDRTFAK